MCCNSENPNPANPNNGGNTPCDDPTHPCPKTVTAKIVSVTFRSDHLDGGGGKLLRPSAGDYKDAAAVFSKPEWHISGKSDPVSHTKNQNVKLDVEIEFSVTPSGTASFSKLVGVSTDGKLTFEQAVGKSVSTGTVTVTGLVSKEKLPNLVTKLEAGIKWTATVDGSDKDIGTSGTHRVYVTFDKPIGKLESPRNNSFVETGKDQDVTEERLAYSVKAADGTGIADEQECVDKIFVHLMTLGVGYILGRRWENGALNNTGIVPKPTLHHYLWRCNAKTAEGECHNIAASFALACRIIGVTGKFEVGYMFPHPSRADVKPHAKTGAKSPAGNNVLGKYNKRYVRSHAAAGHGQEALLFLDGAGAANNFEGVAAYKGFALYAIGDDVFDKFPDPDDNASCYYAERDTASGGIRRSVTSIKGVSKGWADLQFFDTTTFVACPNPYNVVTGSKFKWHS